LLTYSNTWLTFHVIFSDPPGKPGKPVVEDLTEETAFLRWTPPEDDGGAPITNYIVEMKHPGDKKWTVVDSKVPSMEFLVKGLTPETEYIFRVTAENKAGQGPPSDPSDLAKYGECCVV
jgi:titin